MITQESSFLDEMKQEGVKPIKHSSHRARLARGEIDSETFIERRRAATDGDDSGLSLAPIPMLNPLDPVGWRHDGVQEGVYRNLRLARYTIDARLDLLGKTPMQARDELTNFIDECLRLNIRCFVINIGRGRSPTSSGNQLKTYLNAWLPQLPSVMAFHSAQSQHGGTGALYIMLRKSEQARLDNLEKHQKRR